MKEATEVHNQDELDRTLAEITRFTVIELCPCPMSQRYKLGSIPYDHVAFVRSHHLDLASPIIELGMVDCPEWTKFIGVYLVGGELRLKNYSHIASCYLKDTAINEGTFSQAYFYEGRINVMDKQKYEELGAKKLAFFSCCHLDNCVVEEANIYFDWAGMNLLKDCRQSGEMRQCAKQLSGYLYLESGNIVWRNY